MTDQTRAAFEAHFGLTTRQAWQHPDGSYKFPEIQAKWEGYQAGVAKAAPADDRQALSDGWNEALRRASIAEVDLDIAKERIKELEAQLAAAAPEPVDRVLAANQVYQKQVARIAELEAKLRQACDDRAELQACLHMTVSDDSPVAAAAPGADDKDKRIAQLEAHNAQLLRENEDFRTGDHTFYAAMYHDWAIELDVPEGGSVGDALIKYVKEMQQKLAAAAPGASPDYKAQRDMLIDFIRTAPVGTGVCCCGDEMKNHALDSHSPCDQWDHQVRLMVEQIEREDAAPVAAAAPGAVPTDAEIAQAVENVVDTNGFDVQDEHQGELVLAVTTAVVRQLLR